MNLKISSISDADNAEKQRIVIRVPEDDQLGAYAVLLTAGSGESGAKSGKAKAAFWFPDKKISKGDVVVLYTKIGTNSEKTNDGGAKSHFYYWGIGNISWKENWRPVLLHSPNWQIFVA